MLWRQLFSTKINGPGNYQSFIVIQVPAVIMEVTGKTFENMFIVFSNAFQLISNPKYLIYCITENKR